MVDYVSLRHNMINNQLLPNGITSQKVLDSFKRVPREIFVPDKKKPFAYIDSNVSIWDDEHNNKRYLIKPEFFAQLLQAANIKKSDLILDIAAGRGYSTAILSYLCESVVSIESIPQLVEIATSNLLHLNIDNAVVLENKLKLGYPKEGPYDIIIMNSTLDSVPDTFIEQLKPNGRLLSFTRVGEQGKLVLFTKNNNAFTTIAIADMAIPILNEFRKKPTFLF